MQKKQNYILGNGERLIVPMTPAGTKVEKSMPYTLEQAKQRIESRALEASAVIDSLPAEACPNDEAVAVLTLHPGFIAKSYFPNDLLTGLNLRAVGSKPRNITPSQVIRGAIPTESRTTDLFIAGKRSAFRAFARSVGQWTDQNVAADDLLKIEDFRAAEPEERIKPFRSEDEKILFEVVLHAGPDAKNDYVIEGFKTYIESLGLTVDLEQRIYAGQACFVPMFATREQAKEIAKFAFLRVAREMPKLRAFRPNPGRSMPPIMMEADLPDLDCLDPSIKVAIFDGGISNPALLSRWVKQYEPDDIQASVKKYTKHGLAVTSAFLFGSFRYGRPVSRPYSNVVHYRVLDEYTGDEDDQYELFSVIRRIAHYIRTDCPNYVNISLGPDLPVEDDEVHVWTAVLDDLFSSGDILPTIAVGNTGREDRASGNSRIQSPADCVNALAVGACDTINNDWKRADYSSVGPGRRPGVVKPDLVNFGGSDTESFWALDEEREGHFSNTMGTSFAAPLTLRTAVGIRAHMGSTVKPLSVKALLLHHCDNSSDFDKADVGWGRAPSDLESVLLSDDQTAHILYQGELHPKQWIRLRVPVPVDRFTGQLHIKATLCFASPTDPIYPTHYTRCGVETVFRPHKTKRKKSQQTNPDPSPFFRAHRYSTDGEKIGPKAHQWETTLLGEASFYHHQLDDPAFDLHYNPRQGGGPTDTARPVRYALIVTVHAPAVRDLYNQIFRRYRHVLQPLAPSIRIQNQI